MLQTGIPFTKKPVALQFDYKVKMSDRENRIRATGFSKITDVPGKDYPAAILLPGFRLLLCLPSRLRHRLPLYRYHRLHGQRAPG